MQSEQVFNSVPPGAEQEVRRLWPKAIGRVMLVALAAVSGHLGADVVHDWTSDGHVMATPQLADLKQRMSLDTPELSPAVTEHYVDATVGIQMTPVNGYGLFMQGCTGEVVGDGVVMTAAHCFRTATGANHKELGIIAADGRDVRQSMTVSVGDLATEITDETYFPDYDKGNKALDADVVNVDVHNIAPLKIAAQNPHPGETVYIYSRYGDTDARVYGGKVIGENPSNLGFIETVFETDNTNGVCLPGTSGTGMIDAGGNIVGVNVEIGEHFTINNSSLDTYHLKKSELGKKAVTCYMVPITIAKQLLKK